MLQKKKRTLSKKHLSILITASLLVLLIVAYAVTNAVIGAIGAAEGNGSAIQKPELMEGEDYHGNYAIAYPRFGEADIQQLSASYIDENGVKRLFTIMRSGEESEFVFYYSDSTGKAHAYNPPICSAEANFDYTDLYAIETADGLNVFKLSYLFVAVGVLYFNERIELSSDPAEKAKQINRYGLNEENRQSITVTYLDEDEEEVTHKIVVGDKLLTGGGYYFMVDDRNYVYNSVTTNFDYALGGFEAFIHTRLVAEGLPMDNAYEPYLTTGFQQWKNSIHTADDEKVIAGSKVVAHGNVLTPVYGTLPMAGGDGYESDGYTDLTFDLASLKKRDGFGNLISALEGKEIGSYESDEIVATVVADTNEAQLGANYRYNIYSIESAFGSGADVDTVGTPVGDNRYVKVSYDYAVTVEGKETGYVSAHAVIDLEEQNSAIPQTVLNYLKAAKVGVLDDNQIFDVVYTEQNSGSNLVEYVVTEIVLIYDVVDDEPKYSETIGENSVVNYRFVYRVDGKLLGEEKSNTVDLSAIDSDDGDNYKMKQALIGEKLGKDLDLVVLDDTMYCQDMMSFTAYSIKSVDYFVTKELISSFKFVNASERDPFYGESLYINTMDNKYKSYALNSASCERVVRFLGGINDDSSSSSSIGLSGSETVAVGLTPENMLKYGKPGVGLYANTVYFELPRGIEIISSGSEDVIDDYRFLDTLGFTLYISDEMTDGTRYVGSDMYDIIVKIDGEGFEFLEETFISFWARRSLAVVNYSDIDNMTVDLNMEDLHGSYNMEMQHETVWIYNSEAYYEKPEQGGTEYDKMTVHVSLKEQNPTGTLFSQLLAESGKSSLKLSTVYTEAKGEDEVVMDQYDTLGTSCFKDFLLMFYSTHYVGTVSEEEQQWAKENAHKVMSMSLTVSKSSAYPYTYDFYRMDDRRIMVCIYRQNSAGVKINEVSDFYISAFAFKKIVRNFVNLLNGIEINVDQGYESTPSEGEN